MLETVINTNLLSRYHSNWQMSTFSRTNIRSWLITGSVPDDAYSSHFRSPSKVHSELKSIQQSHHLLLSVISFKTYSSFSSVLLLMCLIVMSYFGFVKHFFEVKWWFGEFLDFFQMFPKIVYWDILNPFYMSIFVFPFCSHIQKDCTAILAGSFAERICQIQFFEFHSIQTSVNRRCQYIDSFVYAFKFPWYYHENLSIIKYFYSHIFFRLYGIPWSLHHSSAIWIYASFL